MRRSEVAISIPNPTLQKKIGFLSFGRWTPSPLSHTRSASEALRQLIELAVATDEPGADWAYFPVAPRSTYPRASINPSLSGRCLD